MEAQELERKVLDLERRVSGLSSIANKQDYLVIPDAKSKGSVNETVKDQLFDSFWNKLYLYTTGFESLSNLNLTSVGAGSGTSLFGGSIQLVAAAGSSGNSANAVRNVAATGSFSFSKESQFRTQGYFNSTTTQSNQTIYFTIGSSLVESYGFKILNSSVYGISSKSSVVTTINLNTSVNTTDLFKFEAHYFPNNKVEFFINEKSVGASSTNLPKTTNTIFYSLSISTQDANAKDFGLYFLDYAQKRD